MQVTPSSEGVSRRAQSLSRRLETIGLTFHKVSNGGSPGGWAVRDKAGTQLIRGGMDRIVIWIRYEERRRPQMMNEMQEAGHTVLREAAIPIMNMDVYERMCEVVGRAVTEAKAVTIAEVERLIEELTNR